MKYFYLLFFISACVQKNDTNVIHSVSKPSKDSLIEKKILSLEDLEGIWSNSQFDSLRFGKIDLETYFYPCTGFSITKVNTEAIKIVVQYGEQIQRFNFEKVFISRGYNTDTLFGNEKKRTKQIIAFIYPNGFINLKIADYKVLVKRGGKNEMRYFRIINKVNCEGDFHNSILAELFKLFPIELEENNIKYLITKNNTPDNNCDFIQIRGYKSFSKLQVYEYKYDEINKEQNFQLSVSNGVLTKKIILIRNNDGKILKAQVL